MAIRMRPGVAAMVADTGNHRIQTWRDGVWTVVDDSFGSEIGQLNRPRGVAVFPPAVSLPPLR